MRKEVSLVVVIFIVLSLNIVFATNHTDVSKGTETKVIPTIAQDYDDSIKKAYSCLDNQIKDKTSMSLQEAVFGTLALGSKKNLDDIIESKKRPNDNCWPREGCTIKDTSQVLMAYDRINKDSSKIKTWLSTKNSTPIELSWFLEIDITNHVPSQCTLKYDSTERKIQINDEMKIEGNPGNCLSVSSSGYWLRIRDSCVDKKFEVSCEEDFVTTLLYQRSNGGTVFVSSETHSAPSLGTTSELINAKCFKTGTNCDYEGTLWASLALQGAEEDVSSYIPYLIALSGDNQKYFPSSFIYMLRDSKDADDQYGEILQLQKQNKYWEMIGTPYNRYYDTSIAMLSLEGTSTNELVNAKNYLVTIQEENGCWNSNNIRDTAFILYSGWPEDNVNTGGGSGTSSIESCENAGHYCESRLSCTGGGGNILNNFACSSPKICCSIKAEQEETCQEKGGEICIAGEECSVTKVQAANGACCLDKCRKVEENTCEATNAGVCRNSCTDNEEEVSEGCTGGYVCCAEKPKKEGSWFWIIMLIILIIILILAIIFRNKLRFWWFRWRGKARVSPVTRPGFPPSGERLNIRPINRNLGNAYVPPRSTIRPVTEKDREFEETLKKLKDMGG